MRVRSPKTSPLAGRTALWNGLLTACGALVLAGSAAVAAALLAHKFGRNAETDGFLAAYGCYFVLTIAAQSFRLVVVPDLTRAAAANRLGGEVRAYGVAFLGFAATVCVLVAVLAHPLAEAITGRLPEVAANTAAAALPWLVAAAFLQLLAALAASALVARDSYAVAAVGYSLGGVLGLVCFVLLADAHGLVSLAWALTVNGAVSLLVPLVALALRGDLGGPAPERWILHRRLWLVVEGAAVPVALQAFYVVALRLAAGLGVGRVTSLSYAYLLVATLAYAPSFTISIISSAPLTRRGIDESQAVEHVVHASWISLVLVGGAAGVFALVGGSLVELVLGSAYGGSVGDQIGHLVVELAPWMVGTVTFFVTYPLLFVVRRRRPLVLLAVCALAFDVALSFVLRAATGLLGIALGLGLAVLAVVGALLALLSLRLLGSTAAGLAGQAVVVLVAAGLAFGVLSVVLAPVPAAAVGVVAYSLLLMLAVRVLGLGEAWAYVRALH
jgi:O-antigen/teichoic acid export membrane protein